MVANARCDSAARCVFLSELAGEKAERLEKVAALVALYLIPNGRGAEPTPAAYYTSPRAALLLDFSAAEYE